MFSLEQYQALHQRAGWLQRHDLGRLWVRGTDRRSYLHGLVTNDVEGLAAPSTGSGRGSGCYAAFLTPQGRMITDMYVFERGDALLLTVPHTLAPPVRDRLDQFVFSEDVRIEDATASTSQIGIYGPLADNVVDGLPADPDITLMPAHGFGLGGFEIVSTIDGRQALIAALTSAGAEPVDFETAEVCRIEAGVPRFLVDMTDDTIPLEAGIEDYAISLTKGCYVGQEIIIRVLHRGGGRVARRLVRLGLPGSMRVPAPGARIRSGEREIGSVTSGAMSPPMGHPIALGYVHRDFVEPGTPVDVILDAGVPVAGVVLGR